MQQFKQGTAMNSVEYTEACERFNAVITKTLRECFHKVCTEPFTPEVEVDTPYGTMRLKTRPACPNLVTIVYLNKQRVYKILHEHLEGASEETIDALLDLRLGRPSYEAQLVAVRGRRILS